MCTLQPVKQVSDIEQAFRISPQATAPAAVGIMGNKPATLAMSLDQQAVHSGGLVTGRIYLNVTAEVECSALQFQISGGEHTTVRYERTTGSGDNKKTTTHYAHGHRTLLNIIVPLAQFPSGTAAPGQYEFPFSAQLPAGLPSSMCVSGSSNCRVSYVFTARLTRPGMFKWDVTCKQPLLVQMQPRLNAQQVYLPPDTTAVKFCCCFNKGQMSFGAVLDRGLVSPNEQLGVGFGVKNESTVELLGVDVKIRETIYWSAGGHNERSVRIVAQSFFDGAAISAASAIDKSEKHSRGSMLRMAEDAAREIYQTLASNTQRSLLVIAPTTRHSYEGIIITVRHTLQVTLKTKGCCVTSPSTAQQIFVQSPLATAAVGAAVVPIAIVLPDAFPAEQMYAAPTGIDPAAWKPTISAPYEVPMATAVLGGKEGEGQVVDGVCTNPLSSPTGGGVVERLLGELDSSFDDIGVVTNYTSSVDPAVAAALQALTPPQVPCGGCTLCTALYTMHCTIHYALY
jgi:hypothetical protein